MDQELKITAEPKDERICNFTVDGPILPGGSVYFGDRERARGSPLGEKLLEIEGVVSVLVQDNLVSVTSSGVMDWRPIGRQVGAAIRSVLASGVPPISEKILSSVPPAEEIASKVRELFDTQINPMVAAYGGYVELIDVRANEVFLRLGGGCQGCGAADVTLKQGIERAIRALVPEVGAILDTTDHAAGRNPYYAPSK